MINKSLKKTKAVRGVTSECVNILKMPKLNYIRKLIFSFNTDFSLSFK